MAGCKNDFGFGWRDLCTGKWQYISGKWVEYSKIWASIADDSLRFDFLVSGFCAVQKAQKVSFRRRTVKGTVSRKGIKTMIFCAYSFPSLDEQHFHFLKKIDFTNNKCKNYLKYLISNL